MHVRLGSGLSGRATLTRRLNGFFGVTCMRNMHDLLCRRKLVLSTLLILVIVTVSTCIVAWHDGYGQLTKISDINEGIIPIGTVVTVKGNVTQVLILLIDNTQWVFISDGSGTLDFAWKDTAPSEHSVVVVRGTVSSESSLRNVTL